MTRRELQWTATDPLGEVLHALRMTGVFYCRSELTAPWGLTMPAAPGCLWFHVGLTGRCDITCDSADDGFAPVALTPGSFTLVTQGVGHRLHTSPEVPTPPVLELPHDYEDDRYAVLRHGGGGELTTLVCGIVRVDSHVAARLIQALPPVIHLDGLTALQAEWMQSTIRLMAAESKAMLPGGDTVVTRLADILVVQAIRGWLRDEGAREGWLGALRDPQIGRALAHIHREPERRWTVAELAVAVGMSRSAFAARFTALVGQTPARYATDARMGVARDRLRAPDATVSDVAWTLGYRSEAAFHRAFKRSTGLTPGAVRRGRDTPH